MKLKDVLKRLNGHKEAQVKERREVERRLNEVERKISMASQKQVR